TFLLTLVEPGGTKEYTRTTRFLVSVPPTAATPQGVMGQINAALQKAGAVGVQALLNDAGRLVLQSAKLGVELRLSDGTGAVRAIGLPYDVQLKPDNQLPDNAAPINGVLIQKIAPEGLSWLGFVAGQAAAESVTAQRKAALGMPVEVSFVVRVLDP